LHMHSIHAGPMDGMQGLGGAIPPGHSFTYDFIARPYGVYPFHCHVEPVEQHIQHGLYGLMIIDPPTPRPQMKEMVMMMNGFSFNQQNIAHPNNDPPKMLLPPTAQALREGTADVGTTGVNTDGGNSDNAGTPTTAIPKVLGEVPAGTKSTDKAAVATNSDDPKSATIKNQDKVLSGGGGKGKVPDAVQMQDTNDNPNDDNNNPKQAKDDPLEPGGGEGANDNQFYAVNSKAFGYVGPDMIKLTAGKPVRIYLANIVEFDPMNSFHLHGDLFTWNPSGTAMQGRWTNDIIELGQGDRGIMELQFHLPGMFMFHAHINRFTNLGWLGMFNVLPSSTNSTGLAPNAR
jgi:FtsP/CotA-like multicopper oxidase with cupredoxin domain